MAVESVVENVVEVQAKDIRRTLEYLFPTDEVFELCALNVKENKTDVYKWTSKKYPMGGWFQNKDAAVDLALMLDQQADADAIYVTLNPCPKDLLASVNERIAELQNRTADGDVKQYRNLLIDIDPKRKSKISSNDEEHDYALEHAKTIMSELAERGWSEPMYCDSGNGAHLLYKVEMDVTDDSIGLLKTCLMTLSQKYSNEKVDIDEKVFNPARITKLYGTHAHKGDGSVERPHRISRIISAPDIPQIVSKDQLEALAVEYVAAIEEIKPSKSKKPTSSGSINRQLDSVYQGLDVKAYLDAHQIKITNIKNEGSAIIYCLDQCVFDPSHSPNEAAIVQNLDGSLRYQCFHNSCADKTWEDARKTISGDDKLTQFMPKEFQESISKKKPQRIKPIIYNAADLMKEEIPDIQWVVEGLIPTGLCMIAGKPKMGKSFFSLQLAIAVSNGAAFLNQYPTTKGTVLFLGLEDQKRRLKDRIERLGGTGTQNIDISFDWNPLNNGGLDDLQDYIDTHENVKMIVIDTFACFRFGHQQSKDMYQLDYDQMKQIKRIADRNDVAILLVHHLRKTSSEDPFDQISGSTGIFGSLDTAMILNKSRTNGDSNLLITSRDIAGGSYALSFNEDNCTWSLLGRTDDVVHNEIDIKIINLLRESESPLRSKEIEQALSNETIKESTIRCRLTKMLKREQIIRLDTGLYGLPGLIDIHNNHNSVTNTTCTTGVTTVTPATTSTSATSVTTATSTTNPTEEEFVTPSTDEAQQSKFNNNSRLNNSVAAVATVEGTEELDVHQQDESDTSVTDWFEDIEFESFDPNDESKHINYTVLDDEPTCEIDEPLTDDACPVDESYTNEELESQDAELDENDLVVEMIKSELNQNEVWDEIDEIVNSDLDDEEKFDRITMLYFEPRPIEQNQILTEEEIDYYENQFSDFPYEEPVLEEVSTMSMN